jgi:hypothetical protein
MGQTAGFAAGSWIVRQAARVDCLENICQQPVNSKLKIDLLEV